MFINIPNIEHEQYPVFPDDEKNMLTSYGFFELTSVIYFPQGHFHIEMYQPNMLKNSERKWYAHDGLKNNGKIVK